MAPEQLLAHEIDPRTDIYALGVTLYECLTGVVPFEGTLGEVLLRVNTEPLPPLRRKAPDVPEELAACVERALAREAAQRFPDVRTFGAALRRSLPRTSPAPSMLGLRPVDAPPVAKPSTNVAPQPSPTAVPPPLPAQRRRFARAPYVTPVRIMHGLTFLDGRSEDISVGGLLVLAPKSFEQAETVRVRFALPVTGRVIELSATARWVKAARVTGAVGLEFLSLPADAHEVIERYVTSLGGT